MLISATFVTVLVLFFAVYQNPHVQPVGTPDGPSPGRSFLGILWFTAIVVALGLTLLRRFRLATGAFTLVLGALGLLVTTVSPTFEFLPAIIAASVVYVWTGGIVPAGLVGLLVCYVVPSCRFVTIGVETLAEET